MDGLPALRPVRGLWLLVALAVVLLVPHAAGAVPEEPYRLPTDTLLFDSNRTGNYEIFSLRTDGSNPVQLTDDPRYDAFWPKISPDRTQILFYRSPAGEHDRDYTKTSLWKMDADGTDAREIIPVGAYGWEIQGHAEWSPDGRSIALGAGPSLNVQIWITDAEGRNPRQVTRRGGTNIDPSWAPDGRSLLFVGCPISICTQLQFEIFSVRPDGTGERQLTFDPSRDHDPYYSPDGKKIAWLRENPHGWALMIMDADGTDQEPLLADVGAINSKPGWALDSRTVYFHRIGQGRTGFNIFAIDVATRALRELEPRPLVGFGPYDNEYPVHSSF